MLAYKLQRVGFPDKRFIPLREAWTSRTCSRCGSHDTTRPFQALLICHTCGVQLPADENGALNIGFKLILSCDEAALDHWLPASFLARKYPGQQGSESQSLTKPLLSEVPSVRSVSVAGRKHPCTQEASLTSRPLCGDDTSSPVEPSSPDGDVEPANHKPLLSTFL